MMEFVMRLGFFFHLCIVGIASLNTKVHPEPQYMWSPPINYTCPEDWVEHGPYCYRYIHRHLAWHQAALFCERYGARLVRLEDTATASFIQTNLTGSPQIWTGLTLKNTGLQWHDGVDHMNLSLAVVDPATYQQYTDLCYSSTITTSSLQYGRCDQSLPAVCSMEALPKDQMPCLDGQWIPTSWYDDDIIDCKDATDEVFGRSPCSGKYKGSNGTLSTQSIPARGGGIPKRYYPYTTCIWVVETPPDTLAQITVSSGNTWVVVGTELSYSPIWIVESTKDPMALCPPSLFLHEAEESQGYYPYTMCIWVVETPPDTLAQITFTEVKLEGTFDTVQIYAGAQSEEHSLFLAELSGGVRTVTSQRSQAAYTSGQESVLLPITYRSYNNFLLIKFSSDNSIQFKGFTANWSSVHPDMCKETLAVTESKTSLQPPLYTGVYTAWMACEWILSSADQPITVQIIQLVLAQDSEDYLLIMGNSDNSSPVTKLTAKTHLDSLAPLIFLESHVTIRFVSDTHLKATGFQLLYFSGCEIEVTLSSGVLQSPGYSLAKQTLAHSLTCSWNFAGDFTRLKLTVESLHINSLTDSFQILDDGAEQLFHGQIKEGAELESSSRKIRIVLSLAEGNLSGRHIVMKYTIPGSETPCEGHTCQHGGTCVGRGQSIQCLCVAGFEGVHCERNINECASEPCSASATCVDGVNTFFCHCPNLRYGPTCSKVLERGYDLFFYGGATKPGKATSFHPVDISSNTYMSVTANVRFADKGTQGQFFGLYSTGLDYRPSGLILSLDERGVNINTTVNGIVSFPFTKPVNDVQWHKLGLTVTLRTGDVLLSVDGDKGEYQIAPESLRMPQKTLAVLGGGFQGCLSQVFILNTKLTGEEYLDYVKGSCLAEPLSNVQLDWYIYQLDAGVRRVTPAHCDDNVTVTENQVTFWTIFKKKGIMVNNDVVIEGIEDPLECRELCLQETTVNCRSLDVGLQNKGSPECLLASVRRDDVPQYWVRFPTYQYNERTTWIDKNRISEDIRCPENQLIESHGDLPQEIYWQEPLFLGAQKTVQNYQPGAELSFGIHQISYVATWSNGQAAVCNFKVLILASSFGMSTETTTSAHGSIITSFTTHTDTVTPSGHDTIAPPFGYNDASNVNINPTMHTFSTDIHQQTNINVKTTANDLDMDTTVANEHSADGLLTTMHSKRIDTQTSSAVPETTIPIVHLLYDITSEKSVAESYSVFSQHTPKSSDVIKIRSFKASTESLTDTTEEATHVIADDLVPKSTDVNSDDSIHTSTDTISKEFIHDIFPEAAKSTTDYSQQEVARSKLHQSTVNHGYITKSKMRKSGPTTVVNGYSDVRIAAQYTDTAETSPVELDILEYEETDAKLSSIMSTPKVKRIKATTLEADESKNGKISTSSSQLEAITRSTEVSTTGSSPVHNFSPKSVTVSPLFDTPTKSYAETHFVTHEQAINGQHTTSPPAEHMVDTSSTNEIPESQTNNIASINNHASQGFFGADNSLTIIPNEVEHTDTQITMEPNLNMVTLTEKSKIPSTNPVTANSNLEPSPNDETDEPTLRTTGVSISEPTSQEVVQTPMRITINTSPSSVISYTQQFGVTKLNDKSSWSEYTRPDNEITSTETSMNTKSSSGEPLQDPYSIIKSSTHSTSPLTSLGTISIHNEKSKYDVLGNTGEDKDSIVTTMSNNDANKTETVTSNTKASADSIIIKVIKGDAIELTRTTNNIPLSSSSANKDDRPGTFHGNFSAKSGSDQTIPETSVNNHNLANPTTQILHESTSSYLDQDHRRVTSKGTSDGINLDNEAESTSISPHEVGRTDVFETETDNLDPFSHVAPAVATIITDFTTLASEISKNTWSKSTSNGKLGTIVSDTNLDDQYTFQRNGINTKKDIVGSTDNTLDAALPYVKTITPSEVGAFIATTLDTNALPATSTIHSETTEANLFNPIPVTESHQIPSTPEISTSTKSLSVSTFVANQLSTKTPVTKMNVLSTEITIPLHNAPGKSFTNRADSSPGFDDTSSHFSVSSLNTENIVVSDMQDRDSASETPIEEGFYKSSTTSRRGAITSVKEDNEQDSANSKIYVSNPTTSTESIGTYTQASLDELTSTDTATQQTLNYIPRTTISTLSSGVAHVILPNHTKMQTLKSTSPASQPSYSINTASTKETIPSMNIAEHTVTKAMGEEMNTLVEQVKPSDELVTLKSKLTQTSMKTPTVSSMSKETGMIMLQSTPIGAKNPTEHAITADGRMLTETFTHSDEVTKSKDTFVRENTFSMPKPTTEPSMLTGQLNVTKAFIPLTSQLTEEMTYATPQITKDAANATSTITKHTTYFTPSKTDKVIPATPQETNNVILSTSKEIEEVTNITPKITEHVTSASTNITKEIVCATSQGTKGAIPATSKVTKSDVSKISKVTLSPIETRRPTLQTARTATRKPITVTIPTMLTIKLTQGEMTKKSIVNPTSTETLKASKSVIASTSEGIKRSTIKFTPTEITPKIQLKQRQTATMSKVHSFPTKATEPIKTSTPTKAIASTEASTTSTEAATLAEKSNTTTGTVTSTAQLPIIISMPTSLTTNSQTSTPKSTVSTSRIGTTVRPGYAVIRSVATSQISTTAQSPKKFFQINSVMTETQSMPSTGRTTPKLKSLLSTLRYSTRKTTVATTLPTTPTTVATTLPTTPTTVATALPTTPTTVATALPTTPTTVAIALPTTPTTVATALPTTPTTVATALPTTPTTVATTLPTTPTTVATTLPTTPTTVATALPTTPTTVATALPTTPITVATTLPTTPTTVATALPTTPITVATALNATPTTVATTLPTTPTTVATALPTTPITVATALNATPTTVATALPTTPTTVANALPTTPTTVAIALPTTPATVATTLPTTPTTATLPQSFTNDRSESSKLLAILISTTGTVRHNLLNTEGSSVSLASSVTTMATKITQSGIKHIEETAEITPPVSQRKSQDHKNRAFLNTPRITTPKTQILTTEIKATLQTSPSGQGVTKKKSSGRNTANGTNRMKPQLLYPGGRTTSSSTASRDHGNQREKSPEERGPSLLSHYGCAEDSSQCPQNSTCLVLGSYSQCACQMYFKTDETGSCIHQCDLGYCKNNGKCERNSVTAFPVCQCLDGTSGVDCGQGKVQRSQVDIGLAVGIPVGLFSGLVLLFCCCLAFCHSHRKKRRRILHTGHEDIVAMYSYPSVTTLTYIPTYHYADYPLHDQKESLRLQQTTSLLSIPQKYASTSDLAHVAAPSKVKLLQGASTLSLVDGSSIIQQRRDRLFSPRVDWGLFRSRQSLDRDMFASAAASRRAGSRRSMVSYL